MRCGPGCYLRCHHAQLLPQHDRLADLPARSRKRWHLRPAEPALVVTFRLENPCLRAGIATAEHACCHACLGTERRVAVVSHTRATQIWSAGFELAQRRR
ncbi:Hypothetical Protein RRSL_02883 [Ralstonia solanacearum UW551]|uniref:Uncharacterized protein n=1 Tax=Ralstonia solanacearum (strain UW551) TaxID=342110 RepID=A0AB33VEZ2_RALSU|nr:Hypothetical Protein RRSL_02883 [Ralstonia solanacearum UW551]